MRGVFEDEEFDQLNRGRDTELTLGPGALLLLFSGLVLVCGACFGLGYFVGHRGPETGSAAGQLKAGAQPASQSAASVPKPSATAPTAVPQRAPASPPSAPYQPGSNGLPQSAVAVPVGTPQGGNPSGSPSGNGQLQVRPALPAMEGAQQSAQAATAVPVQPAIPSPAIPLMVQIAAVSHQEDAEVLSNALRKRGYTVTLRREPADNLIHVRVGPFSTRDEANQWRMKLLNDGYNAMIQP